MVQPQVNIQPAEKRARNFGEVSLGYSKKLAIEESIRCPQCSDPVCNRGCPLGIDIPAFIRLLREGDIAGALDKIKEENCLASVCGRICSAPCEAACVLTEENAPISIRALERFASDYGRSKFLKKYAKPPKGKKIAIVGSGPSGLMAAYVLALKGFQVKIFEALDKPGGVLRYGIPEFRIPKKALDQDIDDIKALGVQIKTSFFIGKTSTINELKDEGYVAILLAMGAGIPKFMALPGVNLGGVYYGEEFLMRVNRLKSRMFQGKKAEFIMGDKVVVIGSGNTALDCARAAKRLGKVVSLVFRRTEDEMLVRTQERVYAKEEDIHFEPLVRPVEIMPDQEEFVGGLKCIRLDYGEDSESGEWVLMPVPDSEFIIEADTVIIAIGHRPNSIIQKMEPSLSCDDDGSISIEEDTYLTSLDGVFACGNVVTNAGPVVEAIYSGKQAAFKIIDYLQNKTSQK